MRISVSLLPNTVNVLRNIARKSGLIKRLDFSSQGQEASDLMRDHIDSDEPCMICRFGNVELNAVLTYLIINEKSWPKKIAIFARGGGLSWTRGVDFTMTNNAGFFPANPDNLFRYSKLVLDNMKSIDVLAAWLPGESVVVRYFESAKTIRLGDLEPYYHKNPWSESLGGRKVLVISPFSKSIKKQYYKNRRRLFKNPEVLPDFELLTLQAVQSIGDSGKKCGFNSWFDALDWMCDEIDKMDFEIAIIGAGAYGFSLAAHIKTIGKKAVHMGGATQIMFGIRGKRWDDHPFYRELYNEYWVRPSSEETPMGFNKVESGCYW